MSASLFRPMFTAIVGVAVVVAVSGCTGSPSPSPAPRAAASTRSTVDAAAAQGSPSDAGTSAPAATPSAVPAVTPTGTAPAGTAPTAALPATTPDYQGIGDRVVAGSGGTVIQMTDSSGNWTVVAATSSGAESQAVVAQTTERVTIGPFAKSGSASERARIAGLVAALKIDVVQAATTAATKGGAPAGSLVLGGSGSKPRWHVTLTNGRVVSVDGVTGAATKV
ncbi:hypothetical protein [Curtobacterium ammoniigenes]|uniref:hypothetical protein n=1 Tax=Curtobacterium ammoniigenes TaxID=395387 RepID=UPI00082E88EA|nr:hypothetical protein [Curtobacterium ammoniigenes]